MSPRCRRWSVVSAIVWVGSVLIGGCGGGGAAAGSRAASIEIASGNDQLGLVGQELARPVVVRVTDSAGLPLASQIVSFRVTEGGGRVFAGASITDGAGIARELWTLGPTEGPQKLEARALDPHTGAVVVSATLSATAYATSVHIELVSGGDQTGVVGNTLQNHIVIRLVYLHGLGVPVTTISASHGGSVRMSEQTTEGDYGTSFAVWDLVWDLGTIAASQWLTFEQNDGKSGVPVEPLTVWATAVAGAPARITLTPPQRCIDLVLRTIWPPWPGPAAVTAHVVDSYGNAVSDVPILFTASAGGSVAPVSALTDSSGAAMANWLFAQATGEQSLEAETGEITGWLRREVTTEDMLDGDHLGPEAGTCDGSVAGMNAATAPGP